jgi:hypothetical protein
MSSPPLDPLFIVCHELQFRAQEFVAWFEKWVQTSDSNQLDLTAEMIRLARECTVLQSLAVDVIVKTRERFGTSNNAELLQLDVFVCTLKVLSCCEKTQPFVTELLEAVTRSVLGAAKTISERVSPDSMTVTSLPEATVATDSGNAVGPVSFEQHDLARAQDDGDGALLPIASKKVDAIHVGELKELGFVLMTQRDIQRVFHVSAGGTNVEFAARARLCHQITDVVVCHKGRLWVLPVKKMTPGTQDNKALDKQPE